VRRLGAALLATVAACTPQPGSRPGKAAPRWRLVHHETFDAPAHEPPDWSEDSYGPDSPYHVDAFDEDGEFFVERGGTTFLAGLHAFRSFRKSYRYGADGWLTVELYGRDSDRDGTPETGGQLLIADGHARVLSTRHYDGVVVRSTEPLPARYRVEVTVSDVHFGGKQAEGWTLAGKTNGYDGDERADPWRFTDRTPEPLSAVGENGVYFLCITDYARPAPHNNVFIHHHRKVVMDSDNNMEEWSQVWDPGTHTAARDGSRYVSMLWLDGSDFGSDWTGNAFVSYTTAGWQKDATFVDKYLEGERYVFAIERDGERYTLSVSGKFQHGGQTTYVASRRFSEPPVTWHYNQRADEYPGQNVKQTVKQTVNQHRTVLGKPFDTWPPGSAYPDYFFFGDPHINYYEGSAVYDDVKLYVPEPG